MSGPQHQFWVVVPAAGSGRRFGSQTPKQYQSLGDRTVLEQTLASLLSHPRIAGVQLVLSDDDQRWLEMPGARDPRINVCAGGAERRDSVLAGLSALADSLAATDFVWVHDAARPLLPASAIDRLAAALDGGASGALLGLPVRDTVKQSDEFDRAALTLSREQLWLAQTPQAFKLGELQAALRAAVAQDRLVTDEAQAMESLGIRAQLVEGDARNLKITTAADLQLVRLYLQESD